MAVKFDERFSLRKKNAELSPPFNETSSVLQSLGSKQATTQTLSKGLC